MVPPTPAIHYSLRYNCVIYILTDWPLNLLLDMMRSVTSSLVLLSKGEAGRYGRQSTF